MRPTDNGKEGYLCFIASESQAAVKIGFADDVYTRLKALQTGNPDELTLLGHVTCTYEAEQALHKALKNRRLRLEWYPDDDLTWMLLDELQGEAFDRAMAWLAENDPYSTDPDCITGAMRRAVLSADDVARALAQVTELLEA